MKNKKEKKLPESHMLPPDQKNKQPYTPMDMSDFEKRLVQYEKQERAMNDLDYKIGIQGKDGGVFHRDFPQR